MMLQNHPTFFIMLFAICKIGAIPSLINTNLSDESLLHCVKIADAKIFCFDSLYADQVATIADACRDINVNLFCYGESTEDANADPVSFAVPITPNLLSKYSDKDTSEKYLKGVGIEDAVFLIYTR
jgi:acyl-CoA synthetase (AMP-forming)/AMP-acid ligase II